MKISARNTILGIELSVSLDDKLRKRLVPIKGISQDKPRRWYVYAHVTPDGKYFYIGKGTRRRAWSRERHFLWHRYVEKYLKGKFRIIILQDNLSPNKAEQLESDWIFQEGRTLINWINTKRQTDSAKLEQFNKLRDANRSLIMRARVTEKTDLEVATKMYMQAIAAIDTYADGDIKCESGIVGKLLKECRVEVGRIGDIDAMDRLSLCLVRLGRAKEAEYHMQEYFKKYRADASRVASERIRKRIKKALSKKLH